MRTVHVGKETRTFSCDQCPYTVHAQRYLNEHVKLFHDPSKVKFVKKWVANSWPSFFQILHISPILDKTTQNIFSKVISLEVLLVLYKDSYRNGRNTPTLCLWKSETSRDIKKSFEHHLNIFKSYKFFQN
jgi:hypothetical protein